MVGSAEKSVEREPTSLEMGREESNLSVTVVGASGDLAKKKIFPALFALFYEDCLPKVFLHQLFLMLIIFLLCLCVGGSCCLIECVDWSHIILNACMQNFLVFGYARTKMTDDELRNMISNTLTCRIDKR